MPTELCFLAANAIGVMVKRRPEVLLSAPDVFAQKRFNFSPAMRHSVISAGSFRSIWLMNASGSAE